jgi:hypothetical protein
MAPILAAAPGTKLAGKGTSDELGGDRVHAGRECGSCGHPSLALLVGASVLPAMQDPAAQVEPVGLERGMDVPEMWLSD